MATLIAPFPLSTDSDDMQLLLTNLNLLGWQPSQVCVGPYGGIVVDTQVFRQGHQHHKAAEVILKFLFDRLHANLSRDTFASCYPAGDPRQAREFRNHAFKLLEQIRKESNVGSSTGSVDHALPLVSPAPTLLNPHLHPALAFPAQFPLRRSYFDDCRGLRFEALLCHLSRHVLAATLVKEFHWRQGVRPQPANSVEGLAIRSRKTLGAGIVDKDLPPPTDRTSSFLDQLYAQAHSKPTPATTGSSNSSNDTLKRTLSLHINREARVFLNTMSVQSYIQTRWQTLASELTHLYGDRSAYLATIQKQLRDLPDIPPPSPAGLDSRLKVDPSESSRWASRSSLLEMLTQSDLLPQSAKVTARQQLLHTHVHRAMGRWLQLDTYLDTASRQQVIIDAAAHVNQRPWQLRAVDHPLVISEDMASRWKEWLQKAELTPYEGSKLQLVDILQMWQLTTRGLFYAAGLETNPASPSPLTSQTNQIRSSAHEPTALLPRSTDPTPLDQLLPHIEILPHLSRPPHQAAPTVLTTDLFTVGPTHWSTSSSSSESSRPGHATWDNLHKAEQTRLEQIRALKAKLQYRHDQLTTQLEARQTRPNASSLLQPTSSDQVMSPPALPEGLRRVTIASPPIGTNSGLDDRLNQIREQLGSIFDLTVFRSELEEPCHGQDTPITNSPLVPSHTTGSFKPCSAMDTE
ncbi:hypothetical protein H4R33_005254 [Dimargaris cristalligena]|nr:hypothetical protein H4R33_005254 [Dimargaris cristalligena]